MPRYFDANSTDEREITDSMIEAGVAVFRQRDAFDFFDRETLEGIVAEVYAVMEIRRELEETAEQIV